MIATIVAVFFITSSVCEEFYKGDQVYQLHPKNAKDIEIVRQWIQQELPNIDVWRGVSQPGENVDVHIAERDVERIKEQLNKMGISHSVMIDNLQSIVEEENKLIYQQQNAYWGAFNYEKYNPYSAIKFELGNIARRFRNRCKLFTLGKTYQGQRMTGIRITNGDLHVKKPIIWIDGGIHAREWISVAFVMHFIRELLMSNSLLADRALRKYEFHILPVFNIDGYKYTFSGVRGARFWRKTRSSYGICKGADPNRNWSYKWGVVGTSATACNDDYRGPNPFSEIEVVNVKNYLEERKDRLKAFWNIHAYSQMILTPWSHTKTLPQDYEEIFRVAKIFVDQMKQSKDKTVYKAGPPSHLIYPVGGSAIDWTYSQLGVRYSYALELRDTGKYGFLLPADQIKPTGVETTHALLSAINALKD